MAAITVNSHDILGDLTIVKNYLAMVQAALDSHTPVEKKHIDRAVEANEMLIQKIKKEALKTQKN
jgi:hypothetical protein